MSHMSIKPGKYTHYKGTQYEVITTALHSETHEELVVYRKLYGDGGIWARPATMWNELVEHEGRMVKRFVNYDEQLLVSETQTGIYNRSTPDEKIELFLSLFIGRDDVFAKRFKSKKGNSGYAPACHNFWTLICPKKSRNKIKCGECPNQNFVPYDASAVEKHLRGDLTIGIYPMLTDETCRFLVFDFDGDDYDEEGLQRDISAIRDVCSEKGISITVERSRSGTGIHLWVFFLENVPVAIARRFGSSLITYTMSKNHSLTFKTYDRMIPSQDTMPTGGFGNLIALPLQKIPREQKNSEFINENYEAYTDQWSFMSNIKKHSQAEIENFTRQLSPTSELGVLYRDCEDEKPWEGKKKEQKLSRLDFSTTVKVVRANMIYIDKTGISSPALNVLKRLAAFRNPDFYKTQAMRLSTHEKPRIIFCSEETEQYICLPRGLEARVSTLLNDTGVEVQISDETSEGRKIDVVFSGELRDEQQHAAEKLLMNNNGVLSATTAFGKTVIGAYLIAERKVNTLILVHRTNLLTQWIEQLSKFLIIYEEPVVELTPKGRKRKKSIIGRIGGGKTNASRIIDVAVMQSLISGDEAKDIVKNYGMIIVDECHHVAAFTFEKILKAANARYVYGLTATPTRQDGHHPIINMQCGEIRYRTDAKEHAEARPFEHYLIPRFTKLRKPANRDEKWRIDEVYTAIQKSDIRNNQIVEDVLAAVENGRNPIVLTERKDHVKYLVSKLKPHISNTISLMSSDSQKKNRETLQYVAEIPDNEPFVLVATGKYIGEGFDMPRLDTLFLTMPISWKGTVQQYAGRLHRLFQGKEEVQIYDYVDIHVAMLERMYQKRLKGYASIGYEVKGIPQQTDVSDSIFNNKTFLPVYVADIQAANNEILIVSPFIAKRRVQSSLSYLSSVNAKVTVVTRPLEDYLEKDRARIEECIELLRQEDINVVEKEGVHQKFAVVDQLVVWYGSFNLLGFGVSDESIMRIESLEIAAELMGVV